MNVDEYLESGMLENYCLGLLSDEEKAEVDEVCAYDKRIRDELQAIQDSLAAFGRLAAAAPAPELQHDIWEKLENINKERHGTLDDLPLINKYSDYRHWLRIVRPLIPGQITGEKIQVLRANEQITQVFFISGTAIPDETHEHERESFIVLEGECECRIDNQLIRLGPGGFIEIPMYTHHDVKAITPYVIAVMQRIAV